MSQLPGKKFKRESIQVEGVHIEFDVRVDSAGTFYAHVSDTELKAPTLREIVEKVRPLLEENHRLVWEPFIVVSYQDAEKTSRWDNRQDEEEMVSLRFDAVWRSTTEAPTMRTVQPMKREARGRVVDGLVQPLLEKDRRDSGYAACHDSAMPFTSDRWRALERVAASLAEARRNLAAILEDTTGGKLDALDVVLLPPLPVAPKALPPLPLSRTRRRP